MSVRAALVALALVGPLVAATPSAQARSVWPAHGQAAYVLGGGPTHASPGARKVPIASIAKVMTAYLVLRRYPLKTGANGFRLTATQRDVDDRAHRVNRGESTVPVARGEHLTERQALAALLLPSANNIAIMLARKVSGTVGRFVRAMNKAARTLKMRRTTYTDPSGFDAGTRSTPGDQLRLALVVMRNDFFRVMVQRSRFWIPVAGTIRNTDTLLHRDGFVGIKTGSMSASGGCFLFRSRRIVHGHVVVMTGVVLGQPGGNLIRAGLTGARRLVDRVAPKAAK